MDTAIQATVRKPYSEEEHLLLHQEKDAKNADVCVAKNCDRIVFWFATLGLLFVTFNCGMRIIRSRGDLMAICFDVFYYADLLALLACRRMNEQASAGSCMRGWLKVGVWVLTTLLIVAFCSKVAAVMPPTAALLVWLMAFATVAGGFVALFVCKQK